MPAFFWRHKKPFEPQGYKDACHVRSRERAMFQAGIFSNIASIP
jgi:hypothetical protein